MSQMCYGKVMGIATGNDIKMVYDAEQLELIQVWRGLFTLYLIYLRNILAMVGVFC